MTTTGAPSGGSRRRFGRLVEPVRRLAPDAPPLLAVAVAVGFGLVTLRSELAPAADLNDIPLHASMVRWAENRLAGGKTPLDGWFPFLGLGFPQFHHYQSLPHVLTAVAATIFGGDRAVAWSLYLLLSLWPVSVYLGARLLGWERWPAAVAALASPLVVSAPGYGYEQASYSWQGFGAWPQLWGMWLLPLAWGLGWRAVHERRRLAGAALVVGLTIACHVLTGYLAVLTLALWPVLAPRRLPRRLLRAVVVALGALASSAWLLVPVFEDAPWANYVGYERGTFYYDSFGARRVLGWLFSGSLFDEDRLPVLTVLVVAGIVACGARWRRDVRARATLGAFVLSLVLYFGRPTLGPLLKVLPGSDDLFLHRFIIGVHLAGLLLAGVGATALAQAAVTLVQRWPPTRTAAARARRWLRVRGLPKAGALGLVGLATAIIVLAPAWIERRSYAADNARYVDVQRDADSGDGADLAVLLDDVRTRGDGRAYAGLATNWGHDYRVGYVPVYAEMLNMDVDAVGFTLRVASLSTAIEVLFDESNPEHYRIFGVRYLVLPAERQPAVPATFLRASGRHRLWAVDDGGGYLQAIDTVAPVTADRTTLVGAVTPWLASPSAAAQRPTIAFNGAGAGPVSPGGAGSPGTVRPLALIPEDGAFAASVRLRRPAVVVLASSYHRRWRVTVDGREAKPVMVAPSFVGVPVGSGDHTVAFRYQPYRSSLAWIILGLEIVAAIAVGSTLVASRHDPGSSRLRRRRAPVTAATAPPERR